MAEKGSVNSYFKRKYRFSCVRNKGILVVLIWGLLQTTVTDISGGLSNVFIPDLSYEIFAVIGLYYLFYPLFGLLGEKWVRYKVMMVGSIMLCVGFIIVVISLIIVYLNDIQGTTSVIIALVVTFPFFIGQGIFEANVIQFGTDQLRFSSSEDISSFVYWFWFVYYCPLAIILLMASIVQTFVQEDTKYFVAAVVFGFGTVIVLIAFFTACCFRRYLDIEPAQHKNPVKLIWRVLIYAWKHKQPTKRSAFTYGESPPSRLDLGKQRYGGPFTTEQVEDVRTFLYIIGIFVGVFGYALPDTTKANLSMQYKQFLQENEAYTFSEIMILDYPLTIPYSVVSIAVLIHQFVIIPFFPRYILSMLKRLWIGLFILLTELVITSIISYMINRDIRNALTSNITENICLSFTNGSLLNQLDSYDLTLPFYIMAVPQVFIGISTFLVQFTIFEFILAQGPRSMQGLLVGVWFMQLSIFCAQLTLSNTYLSCYWQYYVVTASFVFISVVVYTIAAYKYKYRQRNELSDINERVIITQYTERQLDNEEMSSPEEEIVSRQKLPLLYKP